MTTSQTVQPISTYNFVLTAPGLDTIGAFTQCTGLWLARDVLEYREGGMNDVVHRLPGKLTYPNLILSRGLTNQDALLTWFKEAPGPNHLKEITLTITSGGVRRVWTFADAYPVRWTGPDLDSHGSTIATESLEIAHGGLQAA